MKPPILWISFIILYWDLVVDSYWLPASRGTNIWKNSGLRMMGSRAALKSVIQTPIKVGLTGSIGMGKSTVTNQLKRLGFPVFDADAIVHKLYSHGGKAIEPLRTICDSAIVEDAVDRKKLMEAIMEDGSNTLISRIESIVHPLVEEEKFLFYHACKSKSFPIIFYDIPLLFESVLKRQKSDTSNIDGKKYLEFDYIITVTASAETQASRVLNRVGMTRQKLDTILAKQVPDEHKRSNSDFLILTDFPGFSEGRYQLAKTIDALYMSNNELISNTLNDMETTNTGEAVIFTDEFMFDMESLQSYRDQSFWDFVKCKMPSVYNLRSEYVEAFTR
jgi:dephospho-CoA kinase